MNPEQREHILGLSPALQLAITAYCEAEGEGPAGQVAVMWSIINRRDHPSRRYGVTIGQVVTRGKAYSCYNDGDARLKIGMQGLPDNDHGRALLDMANGVLAGEIPDPTGGATHFHAEWAHPYWENDPRMMRKCQIRKHIFYREVA